MRRILVITALTASTVALAPAAVAQRARSAGAARIQLRSTSVGRILLNGRGFTVYMFTADSRRTDRCVRIQGCTGVWPPLIAHGRTLAGRGVRSALIGSIRLAGGRRQVTYAGHPLYTYRGDLAPASTDYVGFRQFGGTWKALNAAGRSVG